VAVADSGGTRISFSDRGKGEPVFLCLPGWCVHQTIFAPLAERLSAHHRVLAMDWRGHGESEASGRDVGSAEMLADALAVIQSSGAQTVIPIAQAHAGWVALDLRRRLDQRVPGMIFTSWNPIFTTGNPLAPRFLGAMQAVQDRAHWRETVELLLTMWVGDAPSDVTREIRQEAGTHGFEDWARGGREIAAVFAREGDPLQAMSKLSPSVPVLHVYAQPRMSEYLSRQESFARDHSWFSVHRLEAVSHFPTLEAPDETASLITEFIRRLNPHPA